jgi:predicted amidohydrolase
MRDIRVGAAQFECKDADKAYNLSRIRELTRQAVDKGAEVVSFHEGCLIGYTFVQALSRQELAALAEPIPDGPSVLRLIDLSKEFHIPVLAGMVEVEADRLYNAYIAVGPQGFIAKHRKLHTFLTPHQTPGDSYTVFDLEGCKCGILTCYDNNLPENVRITAMMGAEIIFAPHVTCGTDSPMPGRGKIPREVWENRHRDPVRCRQEFLGPKGRQWLMRWLPTRAYENGVYVVFTNPIGVDYDTIKPGLAMIIDPFGEILVESHALGDDVVVGLLTPEKIEVSSGRRYIRARRPELYAKLVEPPPPGTRPVNEPGWRLVTPKDIQP